MRILTITAVTALAVLPLASRPAGAAEPCVSGVGSANNPAFGTPRPCPSTATIATTTKGKAPAKVTTEGGKTLYRDGDTSIAVGGTLTLDTTTGRGKPRP